MNEELENLENKEEQVEPVEEEKLTQSQVNAIAARARQEGRESALKELLTRYGVGEESEMDEVFGKGQAYDSLYDEHENTNNVYREVMAENALLKTNVDPERWEDVKLILGGKGLDVTRENIEEMIPSHPEWRKALETVAAQPVEPKVTKLGNEPSPEKDTETEEEQMKKLFGLK